ncbi:MAG: hypothetical protein MRY83_09590 [Flavobacteriales bacterium]|nr:hypothetical protein [Flavobacteriales bacterium]
MWKISLVSILLSLTTCYLKPSKVEKSDDSIMFVQEEVHEWTIEDSIPLISGSCKKGRDIGDMSQYQTPMLVGTSKTGDISVRSNAACFEIASCSRNILGKIKSGTLIFTQGPLKNRAFSAGIAYAFPIQDDEGNVCRGYLSYLNVECIDTVKICW